MFGLVSHACEHSPRWDLDFTDIHTLGEPVRHWQLNPWQPSQCYLQLVKKLRLGCCVVTSLIQLSSGCCSYHRLVEIPSASDKPLQT